VTYSGSIAPNTASRLEAIIRQLKAIDAGTTVYAEAQDLLISAKQKLKDWKIN
jgi:hypothetical protein